MSLALTPGSTFAGYRVASVIGRGGMGVVYRAADESLDRTVALKLIATELASDEHFRRRFLRESRLAASLEHPNVVPIYDAGEEDGRLYLAMRYVEGSDLRTLLRGGDRPDPHETLAVLAQVAGALDAAHRRALVHRDVKPANVLVDEDGHAYLTDFGVSKQLGGDSTDTGELVGTLDYLAPEQIRGEDVSGRADQYALACMLYECLAGAPPFHRGTEAQTLWAHMQEPVPPVPGRPELDAVLRKGLAKAPADRYATCAELISEAERALAGLHVPGALVRRRHAILIAGLLLLAGVAAAVLAVAREGGGNAPPPGSGIVAVDGSDGHIGSFTNVSFNPSDVAVGAGAVWMLDADAETIARIDPRTHAVTQTFTVGDRPTTIAAGAGALWVGLSGIRADFTSTARIARVDPATGRVTRVVKVRAGGWPNSGSPQIAVGAGGVWVANASDDVYRLDPASGKLVARIPASTSQSIAVGDAGVWYCCGDNAVHRIDPRTNRVTDTIRVGSQLLRGIAVGAGSVWATSDEGSLWRIDPRPHPIESTTAIGYGATYVAFGEGAVWVANYIDGILSRIDPRTDAITARVPIGAAQSVATGAGSAWASVAGATPDGSMPSTCGPLEGNGAPPDVLIASDFSLQGQNGAEQRAMVDAIRLVLKQHGFRAGRFNVAFRSCDDSTAQAGQFEQRRCAGNAHAYARADQLVAVIGPDRSFCTQIDLPVLNSAPGGPLAVLSPSSSFPGLTRGGRLAEPAPYGRSGEPEVYYPTGERNLFRVIGREDVQAAVFAIFAKQRGLKGVFLVYDAPEDKVMWSNPFRRAAATLRVHVAGEARMSIGPAKLADRVAASHADGVLLGTVADGPTVKALRERLGPRFVIMGGDGYNDVRYLLESAGNAAHGLYFTPEMVLQEGPGIGAAARRFARDFGTPSSAYALHAAQAAEVVLQAIAHSDGSRSSVLKAMRSTRISNGLLGSFAFDRYGDMDPARMSIMRITGRVSSSKAIPGAVVDRVVTVPARVSG